MNLLIKLFYQSTYIFDKLADTNRNIYIYMKIINFLYLNLHYNFYQ